MEGRVSEFALGLDTGEANDEEISGTPDRIVDQSRLADAGFTADHQRAAQPATSRFENLVEFGALRTATDEPHATRP